MESRGAPAGQVERVSATERRMWMSGDRHDVVDEVGGRWGQRHVGEGHAAGVTGVSRDPAGGFDRSLPSRARRSACQTDPVTPKN